MNNIELDNWETARDEGKSPFIFKIILKKFLWYSGVFSAVFALAYWRQENPDGFWSQNQFLIWTFAGVALVIGCGDGLFSWMAREGEYQRKLRSLEVSLIQKAKRLQEAQATGLINLNERCAEIPPILRMSLTKEACCLAGRIGVCEQAATLALANQFEIG